MSNPRIALALVTIFAAIVPSLAQQSSDPKKEPESTDLPFRILDSSGEPVSGATVRLIHQSQTYSELVEHKVLHETGTDGDGYFHLPPGKQVANAQSDDNGFSATWVTVPAREGKPQRTWLLGTSAGAYSPDMELVYAMFTPSETTSVPERLEKLRKQMDVAGNIPTTYTLPACETTFRVVHSDGSPATGVAVTPIQLVWLSKGTAALRAIFVPPQLRQSMQERTDEQGKVTFTTIAPMEFTEIQFESPQHGIQRTFATSNSIGELLDKDLMLFPTGTVAGMVKATNKADAAFLKGKKLLLKSQVQNSGLRYPEGMAIPMHGYAEVTVDEQGRFEIPAIVAGRLTLYDRLEENAARRVAFPSGTIVEPGQVTHVEGQVISTVLVHGTLMRRDTGEPLARAAISIQHGMQSGLSRELIAYARTDEEGRFEARVFPGMIGYSPITVIPGLVTVYQWEQSGTHADGIARLPYGQNVKVPADADTFTLPPLELVPTTTLTGRLIDGDGRPVPNTGVYAFPLAGRTNCDFAQTDGDGAFTMDRIPSTHPPTLFKAGKEHQLRAAAIVSQEPLVLRVEVE